MSPWNTGPWNETWLRICRIERGEATGKATPSRWLLFAGVCEALAEELA